MNANKQYGGALIGKGAYGCVFDPPLQCNGNGNDDTSKPSRQKNKQVIGKVFLEDPDFDIEKEVMKMLPIVDPNSEFTIPLKAECTVTNISESDLVNDASGSICTRDNLMNRKQMIFRHGGETLNTYINKDYKKFFKTVRALTNVIKGIRQMHRSGYVHLDIKPANILYSTKDRKTFLIDFGFATVNTKVYTGNVNQLNSLFNANYPYWPPEFVWYYSKHSKKTSMTILDLHAHMSKSYSHLGDLTTDFAVLNVDVKSSLYIFKTMMDSFKGDFPSKQQHIFANKADVYSLGITILELIKRHIHVAEDLSPRLQLVLMGIKFIVSRMIDPNVYSRWNSDMVYDAWIELLSIKNKASGSN